MEARYGNGASSDSLGARHLRNAVLFVVVVVKITFCSAVRMSI